MCLTVERGYKILFDSPLPRFNRVGPKKALVMENEVNTLARKEIIEVVPPLDREPRFYSGTSVFQ